MNWTPDEKTRGPHLVAVTCPACGHKGFLSGRLRASREVICGACRRAAILGDVKVDKGRDEAVQ